MNIFLQNLASIQKRTSPLKFAHLAEKSEKGSISNLSTKVRDGATPLFIAAWHGKEKCVEQLLAARAVVDQPAHNGATPLLVAAFQS